MTYATHPLNEVREIALILASAGMMATGAMADSSLGGVAIATRQDAADYVMGILSGAGCRMRFAAFQAQVASDGLATPTGEPDDPATLVAAAPLRLLNEGLISEDPGDPQILVSSGTGCD